jgi:predicted nuclease with TOPRIM domain
LTPLLFSSKKCLLFRVQAINAKIDSLEERLNAKIDLVEERLNEKFDRLDAKIDFMETKMDAKFQFHDKLLWIIIGLLVTLSGFMVSNFIFLYQKLK